jgi:hypothetical protein
LLRQRYPAFITPTDPSATSKGPACPSRDSGWLVTPQPPYEASRVATISLCTHAAATTPVEPLGAHFAHCPSGSSLPRTRVGSTSTLTFSGPAQRFTARCSLRARRVTYVTLSIDGFSRFVTSTTAPIATGWNERREAHPGGSTRLVCFAYSRARGDASGEAEFLWGGGLSKAVPVSRRARLLAGVRSASSDAPIDCPPAGVPPLYSYRCPAILALGPIAFQQRGREPRFANAGLTSDQDHLTFTCLCP